MARTKTTTSKRASSSKTVKKAGASQKTGVKKPKEKKTEAVKKTVRKTTVKTKPDASEDLAVSCCSSIKKSIKNSVYTDWEEIGFGDNCKRWYQIKGLTNGNNIAISVSIEGRKKKYNLSLLSLQGTEIDCEFDDFTYTHKDHVLSLTFTYSDKVLVKHTVKYGE